VEPLRGAGWTVRPSVTNFLLVDLDRPERAAILPNDYRTPGQMMGLIGKCQLAIGMRYHFCLFAAIQGVPFLAIKRSDKVADLCEDLRWKHGAGLDQLTAEEFARLTEWNAAYGERFGFPFLFAVKGSTKHDILRALDERRQSSHEEEFREALRQVYRIARFRLESALS
jgi:2-oxo-4-hydroxy-4-carboxy-5-ureidoimidazoline decarboxylase